MAEMMRQGWLYSIAFIFLCGFSASAEDISFSQFADMKSRALKIGKTVGRLQACEEANSVIVFGSDWLVAKFREHMEKTSLSFEAMEKLDAAMLESASSEKNSSGWIYMYKEFDPISCAKGDVCCIVERDMKIDESRLGDFFSKF